MTEEQEQAILDFIAWLYDVGPDPASMTREKLFTLYEATLIAKARIAKQ